MPCGWGTKCSLGYEMTYARIDYDNMGFDCVRRIIYNKKIANIIFTKINILYISDIL